MCRQVGNTHIHTHTHCGDRLDVQLPAPAFFCYDKEKEVEGRAATLFDDSDRSIPSQRAEEPALDLHLRLVKSPSLPETEPI